ncbi:MAG: entericidin A/B family lipoprotein [Rickettsia endosymbiont of Eriopis connexa]|nr:entericidin A/B family lipoprotein [Rickettsia endosymbiont of Eriopis connexa]
MPDIVLVSKVSFERDLMQGAGQDMQATGKKLEDSAERNKPKKSWGCH